MTGQLRAWARRLKREALTVYFVARDRRTPWIARALAVLVAGYALSPIDLVPDFIPVLGLLDDLLLVPLGVWLVLRLVPASVVTDARVRAEATAARPASPLAAAVIVCLWLVVLAWLAWMGLRWWHERPG